MGIKYPNLGTLQPIHRELVFFSYALEIFRGQNLKNLHRLIVNSVHNYLRVGVSHATDNVQRDPHIWYTPYGLTLDGAKPFPILQKLLSHMSKWAYVRDEAIPLTTSIIRYLEARS